MMLLSRRSTMLRVLWIQQRWIAPAEPKVLRIAFDYAFAPSAMTALAPSGRARARPVFPARPEPL